MVCAAAGVLSVMFGAMGIGIDHACGTVMPVTLMAAS